MLSPTKAMNQKQTGGGGRIPYSKEVGDIVVPFNVSATVFRYRAPEPMQVKNPCIYCGEILSPTGAPVKMEAWKNGEYGGDVDLHNGANLFEKSLPLQGMDLLELRVKAMSSQTDGDRTTIRDLWVMWSR